MKAGQKARLLKNIVMNTLRLIASIILLSYWLDGRSQQLMPGDPLPDYTFTELLNYPKPALRTADLRGKAVILDFWTTYCAPCIKEMPYMDSLQKEYGDRLQIIAIALELKPSVNKFIDRLTASHYFPYNLLPFPKDTTLYQKLVGPGAPLGQHTWIDAGGRIRYFSQGRELLSRQNIELFLAGKPIPALDSFVAGRKLENQAVEHPVVPVAGGLQGSGSNTAIVSSYLANWTQAMGKYIPSMIYAHMPDQAIHVSGAPVSKLYFLAYGDTLANFPVPVDGVNNSYGKLWPEPLMEVHPKAPVTGASTGPLYYYHQTAPDTVTNAQRLQAVMQSALQAAFGYRVVIETRQMPCWRLTVSDADKVPYDTKDSLPADNGDEGAINFSSLGSSFLICKLYGAFPMEPPFIDATGLTRKLRISIAHEGNFEKLKAGLASKGFMLTKSTTPMRVIVIKD